MNRVFCRLCVALPLVASAATYEITDFFDTTNRCDYLIVVPRLFSEGAEELAHYRNGFSGDDVESARYVILEELYSQFNHSETPPDSLLRESIAWARTRWFLRPSYIVFIGDDSATAVPGDSLPHHGGPMPTHIEWNIHQRRLDDSLIRIDTTIEYSDHWLLEPPYTSDETGLIDADLPPAFGRIPCERPDDLTRYIDKVKHYDAQRGAPWRNRVLFLADDNRQMSRPDPIDHGSCVATVIDSMRGRFASTLYLSRYEVDTAFNHPPAAKLFFFERINEGSGWTVFFGHGHPIQLTDERFLGPSDKTLFANGSRPTVMFSLSCSNGAFYKPADSSMCKTWLFSVDGGAIAYIASPNEEYSYSNLRYMNRLVHLDDSLPGTALGMLIAMARPARSSSQSFEVLGDPAIRASRERIPLALRRRGDGSVNCIPGGGYAEGDSLYWECTRRVMWSDTVHGSALPSDTLLCSGTARLVDGSFDISASLPSGNDSLRLTVYAWNDHGESRGETMLCEGCADSPETGGPPVARAACPSGSISARVGPQRNVRFTFEPRRTSVTMMIIRPDGRCITRIYLPAGNQGATFRTIPAPGTYLAVLRSSGNTVAKTRFVVP